ncbi:MAG: hypothetical protein JJE22_17465 [Bacteroidia bacterium]|nr:hypothetical protein [Bacteroidia bacterium]
MKLFRYIILVLIQVQCVFAYSQKQHIRFEHLGTNMGLSQSNVISILQDSHGFMWFGTRDGLNKYDGYKFTVYKYDADDTNSLSQNTIQDIAEDSDGNLWIGTWGGGLNMFDRKKGKFVHHHLDTKNPKILGSKLINSLLCDSDGNMWIGTEGQGLQMFDKKNNKFISYIHSDSDPKSLGDDVVKDIVEDSQHNLWLGTNSGGLDLFDKKTKTFRHFQHDEKNNKSLSSNADWNLFIDSRDQLWIGTRGGGVDLFDRRKEAFIHFVNNPADINTIQSNVIRAINEDAQGNIWIGTENGGLGILNTQTRMVDNYLQDDADNTSISNNSIWSICKDNKGNMWVGTFSAGINFVSQDANKFIHYRHNSSPFSLNNNNVLSILEDSKQNLWIGTDGGGMNLFDAKKGTFSHYMHEESDPNSICGNYVLKLFEDSEGNLWIGTWGGGITVFNKEKNTFKHFKSDPANPKGLGGNNVWTISEDIDKNIWIGLYNSTSALDMYDRKTNSFVHYKEDVTDHSSLSSNTINTILPDRKGNLWIGTNGGGLDLYNKATKTFSHINKETKNSISNNDINCLAEDRNGNLWIGTGLGLNRMDGKTGRITSYFIKDGLPSNTIAGILTDEKGNLWISTFNGLSRFDPTNKLFKNFGINDGLQSNEFKMNSCFKSHTGRMYFGGINGFNGFDPDSIKEKVFEPPLVFTNFQIFNKQIPISTDNIKSPLKTNITDTKEITLSYNQSVISFEFASLNYIDQDKKRYSYILEGFDKDWNNVGVQHTATYTNLDAGKYTLKVRGLNNAGEWSSDVASLRLIITPPLWLTWWFKLISIVSILGGAIAFYRLRINSIQKQKKKLQLKVQEQTGQLLISAKEEQRARQQVEQANIDLERKNKELEQFAYVASHDLQEPLRTTSSFAELLQQQYKGKLDEKADKYLTFINQSADRMKVLIKDLLDYSRIGRKKEVEQVDCNIILQGVLADLDVAIKEANAEIRYCKLPVLKGYSTEIKQLFQNLIINAIKFRKQDESPKINICAKRKNNDWEFSFNDNGIGISDQHSERIFVIFQRLHTRSEYEGSGIGLANCKKIVELHGGKIWVKSIVGEGSTFYFTIPENKNL